MSPLEMDPILTTLLRNALEATLLALGVGLLSKVFKVTAPARHLLWLLVLLKLSLPPAALQPWGLSRLCAEGAACLLDRSKAVESPRVVTGAAAEPPSPDPLEPPSVETLIEPETPGERVLPAALVAWGNPAVGWVRPSRHAITASYPTFVLAKRWLCCKGSTRLCCSPGWANC